MSIAAARRQPSPLIRIVVLVLMAGLLAGCGINNIPTYEERMKAG